MPGILKTMLAAVLLAGCGMEADLDSVSELESREDGINACVVGAAPYSLCNNGRSVCIYPSPGARNADCRPQCGVGCGSEEGECCIGYASIDYCEMNRGCMSYLAPTSP